MSLSAGLKPKEDDCSIFSGTTQWCDCFLFVWLFCFCFRGVFNESQKSVQFPQWPHGGDAWLIRAMWSCLLSKVCRKDCAQLETDLEEKWAGLQRQGKRQKPGETQTTFLETRIYFHSENVLLRFAEDAKIITAFSEEQEFKLWATAVDVNRARFKRKARGMYPTRALACQRLGRCPACALWIALLLHAVLDLSASGEFQRVSLPVARTSGPVAASLLIIPTRVKTTM